ncbi:MAG: ATP-binding cassette domain-containing protein [Halieaceae bacterium]|nr:ATP-binding cassette domain-containing protein [Halieaceae bacterium]
MIILEDIALRRGQKLLFSDASATLQPGQKIALIGGNCSGKSNLFALLLDELQTDAGDIRGLKGLRISHMAQETATSELTARDYVIAGDAVLYAVLQDLAKADAAGEFERSATLHQQMEELDGYSAERRAEQLLLGLGFQRDQMDTPMASFSGGWRIRLNLARALMAPSDLMLLDEPTNHLDLDTTLWLQSWLQGYRGTLLMISHDRDFIDATCGRTLEIAQQTLTAYRGGYSDYERQRAEKMAQQQAQYEKQQRRITDIEDFVRRFRAKATKARQAQSRLKELERMQKVAQAHIDSPFSFSFPAPGKVSDPLLTLSDASLGHGEHAVLSRVSVSLSPGDRIGLLGKNGAGKTTLLKSLMGELPLMGGERTEGAHLQIGYFDQQQLEVLDLDASPFLHIQRLSPKSRDQEILDFLGGFDFRGDRAREAIRPFSGGEKARLALAHVAWQAPNVLILDEPTNHLDLDMRHALEVALQDYAGAIVLVSHDRHLLRNSVEQLLLINNGSVTDYAGDVETYEKWVLSSNPSEAPAPAPNVTTEDPGDRKARRQAAANQRAQRQPLKKSLRQLEQRIEKGQQSLQALQAQLADGDLYSENVGTELAELMKQEGQLKRELAAVENEWLEQQEMLEALDTAAS